jgi:YD repeat-containing protein
LNRLTTASDSINQTVQWGQQYGYDSFGNLLSKTLTPGSGLPNSSWVVNPLTHQTGSGTGGTAVIIYVASNYWPTWVRPLENAVNNAEAESEECERDWDIAFNKCAQLSA